MAPVLLGALLATPLVQCSSPTTVRLEIFSDVPCEVGSRAVVVVAATLPELSVKAPSSESVVCAPSVGGNVTLGDVVIAPSGANDGPLAFSVARRTDGQPPEDCTRTDTPAESRAACIVAHRELRFSPHQTVTVRIDLRQACRGVACSAGQTCVRGACVTDLLAGCTDCGEGHLGASPVASGAVPGFGPARLLVAAPNGDPPWGLTADRGLLFWADRRSDTIGFLLPDGGLAHFYTATGAPMVDVAATDGWCGAVSPNCTLAVAYPFGVPNNVNGVLFLGHADAGASCSRVALGPHDVWRTEARGIVHSPLQQGLPADLIAVTSAPVPITARAATVYWADRDAIHAASVGAAPRVVATGAPRVIDLVTDGLHVYWLSGTGVLARAPVDGGAPESLMTGLRDPARIAVDDTHVYWTELSGVDHVRALRKDRSGAPLTLSAMQPSGGSLAVSAAAVYWVAASDGAIWTAPKVP